MLNQECYVWAQTAMHELAGGALCPFRNVAQH